MSVNSCVGWESIHLMRSHWNVTITSRYISLIMIWYLRQLWPSGIRKITFTSWTTSSQLLLAQESYGMRCYYRRMQCLTWVRFIDKASTTLHLITSWRALPIMTANYGMYVRIKTVRNSGRQHMGCMYQSRLRNLGSRHGMYTNQDCTVTWAADMRCMLVKATESRPAWPYLYHGANRGSPTPPRSLWGESPYSWLSRAPD